MACITLYQVPRIQASCMHELAFSCIREEIAQFYLTNAENLTHQFKCGKYKNVSYVKRCSNGRNLSHNSCHILRPDRGFQSPSTFDIPSLSSIFSSVQ